MRNVLSGLRNKKIIFISPIVFSLFMSIFVGGPALAGSVKYTYSKNDCKLIGTTWKKGFSEWGCDVWVESGWEGFTNRYVANAQDLSGFTFYNVTGGDDTNIDCISGFQRGSNSNGFKGCVRKDDNASGLPKGVKSSDILSSSECIKNGGWWSSLCSFAKTKEAIGKVSSTDGKGAISDDNIYSTSRKGSYPDKYYANSSLDKCPNGYKKEIEKKEGTSVTTCTKIVDPNADDDGDGVKNSEDSDYISPDNNSETSCAIDSVGWIVCPTTNFMQAAVTGTYEWIAKHFLTIQSGSLFTEGGEVYKSWEKFRDIANVLFVILFVVVIVSQITNVGISNYGIKKMLPRLVAFAILINISYWVSVIFVDLSNIIGRGIFNLLSSNGSSSHVSEVESLLHTLLGLTGVATVMGGVFLSFVAALLAIFLMFVVLIVRQAAVVVLIVVSPIAFAAAILPGTEPFFSKWRGMLKSMLVVYPVCSLMMGGMIAASDVLIATVGKTKNPTDYALKIIYILLPMVGLLSVYIAIKGALAVLDKLTGGSISGKIGGMVNGLQDKAKNSSLAQRERNMWGTAGAKVGGLPGVRNVRDFSRRSRYKALSGKNKLENAKAEAERDGMIAELQSQASRGKLDSDGQRLLHKLQGDKEKDEANLLNAGASSMAKSFGYNEMGQFTGDVEGDAERALTEAIESGNSQQIDRAIKAIGAANLSDGQRASVLHRVFSGAGHIDTSTKEGIAIAQAVSKNMDLFGKMKAENFAVNSLAGKLASNQSASLSGVLQDASTYSNMTAEQLTKQGGDSMENIRKLAANNPQFAAQMQNLAETASKDTELMAQAKGVNKEFIDELKAGVQSSNVVNQESSTVSQENPTVNQDQSMPVDINYGESFVVPRDSGQQDQWIYPAPQQTQQNQQTQQPKPTGQPVPTRKVSGGVSSGNPRHLTVNQQQLEKIRRSPGYNNTKKPE